MLTDDPLVPVLGQILVVILLLSKKHASMIMLIYSVSHRPKMASSGLNIPIESL